MALKAYVGTMGSGKSYEVVSTVILGALRRGRRVVSNIAGLNFPLMVEVLIAEGVLQNDIGQLVQVDHEEIKKPSFWLNEDDYKAGKETTIKPGDVVCLDEIWRFWNGFAGKDGEGNKEPAQVMNFFRMHRQFPHPVTGVTCDIALITQDVADVSRKVKGVIEETYLMSKLLAVGRESSYRVDIFTKTRVHRKPLRSLLRNYNPAYFPLYKSHAHKAESEQDVKEINIDDRGNALKGAFFRVVMPLAVLAMIVGGVLLYRFFHRGAVEPAKPAAAGVAPASGVAPAPVMAGLNTSWRVVGFVQDGDAISVSLVDTAGSVRVLDNAKGVKVGSLGVEVELPEGGRAVSWVSVRAGGLLK